MSDSDRLARFEQEARAASALNHPNIVPVYEVGRNDSISYIAMELVTGKTLRELVAAGPMPIRKILSLGTQFAEGLARAHAAGIAHRDLKPENVIVSDDGFVKILDFGLSRIAVASVEELTRAPTIAPASPQTQSGVVLGTVGYMSPEQAAGRAADYRSDQFSFGAVLYEMAIGQRAFQGDSAAETLAAIIRSEPEPVASARPEAPPPLTWIIERCLAKDPEGRYESTRDLARELANLRDRSSGQSASKISGRLPGRSMPALPWIIAAALLVALLASLLIPRAVPRRLSQAANGDPVRLQIGAQEGTDFSSAEVTTHSAISPDGRSLALVATSHRRQMLYLHRLDSLETRPLPGTEGATSPFWSPDGRFLGYFTAGELKRIEIAGGPSQTICRASWEGVGSWSRDGNILFAQAVPGGEGIYCVRSDGGEPRRVTVPDESRGERFHFWPHFLPDGRHFLYVALIFGKEAKHEIRIASLEGGETKALGTIDSRVEYAPPGFLLFVREGTLLAQPFDSKTRRWTGEARRLVEGLYYFYGPANAGFSVSRNGVLATEAGKIPSRLVWLDRGGKEVSTLATLEQVQHVRLSRDGQKAALAVNDPKFGTSDIWVYDLARNVPIRLTSDPADEIAPVWFPDGSRLLFRSDRNGPPDIYEIGSGGGEPARPVLELAGVQEPEDISPDGRLLLYMENLRSSGVDLWLLPLSGDRKPTPFLRTQFEESDARFSPDGRWVAYDSDESGALEIYVAPLGGGGERVRISTDGGFLPRWRRDGNELFYLAPGGRLMAAAVHSAARFESGTPVELFRIDWTLFDYDVAPDGQRFILSIAAKPPPPPISILVNWPAALKEKHAAPEARKP